MAKLLMASSFLGFSWKFFMLWSSFFMTTPYRVGSLTFFRARVAAHGKYKAICEGDDYWLDPFKLQKQIGFFRANPKCVICGHRIKLYNQENNTFTKITPKKPRISSSFKDFFKDPIIPTVSLVYVKDIMNHPPDVFYNVWSDGSEYYGDWENDMRHGHGEMLYADRKRFVGRWQNDTFYTEPLMVIFMLVYNYGRSRTGSFYLGQEWLLILK